nr:hypothetical protein [Parachlamydiaceae bacterium]
EPQVQTLANSENNFSVLARDHALASNKWYHSALENITLYNILVNEHALLKTVAEQGLQDKQNEINLKDNNIASLQSTITAQQSTITTLQQQINILEPQVQTLANSENNFSVLARDHALASNKWYNSALENITLYNNLVNEHALLKTILRHR